MEQNTTPTAPDSTSGSNNRLLAVLAYIGILVIIPLIVNKNDAFVKFHSKQGIILLIAFVISNFLWAIPFLGWIAAPILYIVCIVLAIIGIINALNGHTKELPLIGSYASHLHF